MYHQGLSFNSRREAKQFAEAETAFFARRETRRIRAAARIVDPNSGFRLSITPAMAEKIRAAGLRMEAQKLENQREIAARRKVKERDLAIATKSAEAQKRRTGRA